MISDKELKELSIRDYRPEWRPYFESLNRVWIEKYFAMEPHDEFLLTNPENAILSNGGKILFALLDEKVIGTVAIIKIDDVTYELSKMGVEESFRGNGVGKQLCAAAISKARAMGASRLILYTHSSLKNAIRIYERMGFKEIPVEPGKYDRADVKMELKL